VRKESTRQEEIIQSGKRGIASYFPAQNSAFNGRIYYGFPYDF
jgi:hypothetical protein